MRTLFYISVIALIVSSCSTSQFTTGSAFEDDLYYNPKEKPLVIQEVEKELPDVSEQEKSELLEIAKKSVKAEPEKYPDITNVDRIEIESVEYKKNPETGAIDTIIEIMSQGYWVNGFRGSNAELEEAMRIIDQYPNGFGYFGHGNSIGENLSFDTDWNVYTKDGKYWWFPRVTNLTMYNQFMFGSYPKYQWTVIWDSPNYDYWDFDFHFGYSSYWRWRTHSYWYHRPYWHNSYWHLSYHYNVDPWYHHWHMYDYPYYRRYYKRHSDPQWYRSNYRYGPRRSMFTKTLRTNTNGTQYRTSSGLKSLRRGTTTRTAVPARRGTTTLKTRTGTSRVSSRATGVKSRYRPSGTTVKSRNGTTTTRSRYSSQSRKTRTRTTTTKTTTTQSRKSTVRRYSKPRSTSRPSYNRSKTRKGSTYQRGTSKTRSGGTYRKGSGSSKSSSRGTYNKKSSGSYNKSGSSRSRTYSPSSRSRSSSSSSRSTSRSSSSRSRSSSSSSRSRTR